MDNRETQEGIKVVGNYSPSGHNATRVLDPAGLAPTVMENHGSVSGVVVKGLNTDADGNCRTLKAQCAKNSAANFVRKDGLGATCVLEGVRIRKLTPRETWRLQGFPDEYFDRAKAAGVSNSQLYKQAGNAVTVTVAYAIAKKMAKVIKEKSDEG